MPQNQTVTVGKMDVPVHPAYEKSIYNWTLCRDAVEGESAIKMKNELYLPMPAAMSLPGAQPHSVTTGPGYDMATKRDLGGGVPYNRQQFNFVNPNYHTNRAYSAYLTRAQFPELTSFILRGLMGLAFSDEPTVQLPKRMEYMLENSSVTGQSLVEYYSYILLEVMTTGRIMSVLDVDPSSNQIMFAPYITESILNWKVARSRNSAAQKPLSVLATETIDEVDDLTEYKNEELDSVARIFHEDGNGNFSVTTKTTDSDVGTIVTPEYKGRAFPGMALKMYAPLENNFKVQTPPLYGVASSSVQIYMKYADLSNSEFMSCSPTLVISGVSEDFSPKALGSTVALILPDADAKAYFTTTDTSALSHVLAHITDLYEQAIYSGAQLLDSSKKAAESAETTRLKQTGTGATLASVVRNVAKGVEQQLKEAAMWMGEDPNKVSFRPITEFMSPALTAQEQTALVNSWVQKAISHSTLLENFRKAGLLKDGSTVEDEMALIDQQIDRVPNITITSTPNKDDEDKDE